MKAARNSQPCIVGQYLFLTRFILQSEMAT